MWKVEFNVYGQWFSFLFTTKEKAYLHYKELKLIKELEVLKKPSEVIKWVLNYGH